MIDFFFVYFNSQPTSAEDAWTSSVCDRGDVFQLDVSLRRHLNSVLQKPKVGLFLPFPQVNSQGRLRPNYKGASIDWQTLFEINFSEVLKNIEQGIVYRNIGKAALDDFKAWLSKQTGPAFLRVRGTASDKKIGRLYNLHRDLFEDPAIDAYPVESDPHFRRLEIPQREFDTFSVVPVHAPEPGLIREHQIKSALRQALAVHDATLESLGQVRKISKLIIEERAHVVASETLWVPQPEGTRAVVFLLNPSKTPDQLLIQLIEEVGWLVQGPDAQQADVTQRTIEALEGFMKKEQWVDTLKGFGPWGAELAYLLQANLSIPEAVEQLLMDVRGHFPGIFHSRTLSAA